MSPLPATYTPGCQARSALMSMRVNPITRSPGASGTSRSTGDEPTSVRNWRMPPTATVTPIGDTACTSTGCRTGMYTRVADAGTNTLAYSPVQRYGDAPSAGNSPFTANASGGSGPSPCAPAAAIKITIAAPAVPSTGQICRRVAETRQDVAFINIDWARPTVRPNPIQNG